MTNEPFPARSEFFWSIHPLAHCFIYLPKEEKKQYVFLHNFQYYPSIKLYIQEVLTQLIETCYIKSAKTNGHMGNNSFKPHPTPLSSVVHKQFSSQGIRIIEIFKRRGLLFIRNK